MNGYNVCVPIGDNCKYDALIEKEGVINRVQIKATNVRQTDNNKDVYRCGVSCGNGKNNIYTKKDIDFIAIVVLPESAWYFIPIEEIKSKMVNLYPHREPLFNKYEKYRIV